MKVIYSLSSKDACYECDLLRKGDNCQFSSRRAILPGKSYVQKILNLTISDIRLVWCFRKSGVLELLRYDNLGHQYEKVYELLDCKKDEKDFAIALLEMKGIIYCCTNKGKLTLVNMNNYQYLSGKVELPVHSLQLSEPLACFTINPQNQWVVACGGYGNHLQLYHLITPFNEGMLTDNYLFKILNFSAVHRIAPFWIAKTTKKSQKELEDFPWITDIVFLETDPESEGISFCCVTQFGKISFYDTTLSKNSIHDMVISNHRIRLIQRLSTSDLIFVDSFGLIGIIRSNDSILYHYRLQNFGSLSGCDIVEAPTVSESDAAEEDDEEEDLLQLAAKRQSHTTHYKTKKTIDMRDIYVVYTTIIGELKMIKLKPANNQFEVVCSTKLAKSANKLYGIPCLKYVFDDYDEFMNTFDDERKNEAKKCHDKTKTKPRYKIKTYI